MIICQGCVYSSFLLPQVAKKSIIAGLNEVCYKVDYSRSNSGYMLCCIIMKMIEMFGRQLVVKIQPHRSFVGTLALHVKPHTGRLHVNRFRHANLLPCVTDSCCMRSYADIRRECITFTLCIVQFYYVNSLLLLLLSWTWACVSVCVCVCSHTRLGLHGCRPGCYIRIYILSCLFGFVINLPAEYIIFVLLHMQACVPVNLCVWV